MAGRNINKQVFIYLKTSQESSPYDIAKKNKSWQDLLTIYIIQDWKEQTANDWIWWTRLKPDILNFFFVLSGVF